MRPIKTHVSDNEEEASEGEEGASQPASEEDEMGEEEEEDEEMQEDGDQPGGENSGSEDSFEEPDRHPYPTPPPDDGSKMAPLDAVVKSKTKTKPEGAQKKGTYLTLAMMAIEKLKDRSGSSAPAILKYLKENGHPSSEDEKRQLRSMGRALKVGVATGQLVMIKRSFKLSESAKKASTAVEKMKAKKAKQLAREKEKEKLKKEKEKEKAKKKTVKKAEKYEAKAATKREKPSKPSERKTKQSGKKKNPEEGIKDAPPKAKTAASVAARALLDTPTTNDEKPAKQTGKAKANSSEAGKSKKPRKSIGTLAQNKTSKPNVKAVKKLVAAKGGAPLDDVDVGELSEAQATSTPQAPSKAKRKRKV